MAVLKNLPAPIDKMPPWFIQNVQRFYDFDIEFYEALRKKKQERARRARNSQWKGSSKEQRFRWTICLS